MWEAERGQDALWRRGTLPGEHQHALCPRRPCCRHRSSSLRPVAKIFISAVISARCWSSGFTGAGGGVSVTHMSSLRVVGAFRAVTGLARARFLASSTPTGSVGSRRSPPGTRVRGLRSTTRLPDGATVAFVASRYISGALGSRAGAR